MTISDRIFERLDQIAMVQKEFARRAGVKAKHDQRVEEKQDEKHRQIRFVHGNHGLPCTL